MVSAGVEGFNKNRQDNILASVRKVMDESMSAFKPQTRATGKCQYLNAHMNPFDR